MPLSTNSIIENKQYPIMTMPFVHTAAGNNMFGLTVTLISYIMQHATTRLWYSQINWIEPHWLCEYEAGLVLCCLMTPGLSKDIGCRVWSYFSKLANHQIRHQATHKVSCQPGDCIWSFQYSFGVWVNIHVYGLTYSLMTLEGNMRRWLERNLHETVCRQM